MITRPPSRGGEDETPRGKRGSAGLAAQAIQEKRAQACPKLLGHLDSAGLPDELSGLLVRSEIGATRRAVTQVGLQGFPDLRRQRLIEKIGKDSDRVFASHDRSSPPGERSLSSTPSVLLVTG
jgi:hypothetical protein